MKNVYKEPRCTLTTIQRQSEEPIFVEQSTSCLDTKCTQSTVTVTPDRRSMWFTTPTTCSSLRCKFMERAVSQYRVLEEALSSCSHSACLQVSLRLGRAAALLEWLTVTPTEFGASGKQLSNLFTYLLFKSFFKVKTNVKELNCLRLLSTVNLS